MGTERPLLTVYSRPYCHLCEDMIEGLRAMQARYAFDLQVVDIDDDPALEERYGHDVPVLAHGARELCRHALASAAVTEYLGQFS